MSIIRVSKRERYVVIDKTGLEDSRLSFKAKGLLSFLLSKPDDWTINYRNLTEAGPDGRDAILSGLDELSDGSYLVRARRRTESGAFEWEQVLYERPVDKSEGSAENPQSHAPETGTWSDQGKQRESAGGDHAPVNHAPETGATNEEGLTERSLSKKRKTQILREWEKKPCPHEALHCNRVTAFCDRCTREWRELVA